jgi:hypothetical protein
VLAVLFLPAQPGAPALEAAQPADPALERARG